MSESRKKEAPTGYEIGSGVAIVLIILFASWFVIEAELDIGTAFSILGVAISICGLIVAILIFTHQKRHSEASESRIKSTIEGIALSKARGDVSDDSIDFYEAEAAVLKNFGKDIGGNVLRLDQQDVPLKIVRDLVVGWENSGQSGAWTVNALVAAMRKTGKGNHAWWLIMREPTCGSEVLFKVSKGGKGKAEVTVSEVPLNNMEPDLAN